MSLTDLIDRLATLPDTIEFSDVIACIDDNYEFMSVAFSNGEQNNAVGENVGSCKIFAFAKIHELDEQQTLACFGQYYRNDVLNHPNGDDHQNIRQFMKNGWAGIRFTGQALSPR